MGDEVPRFSKNQREFLAVLACFHEPVCMDTVGVLAPLLPGPLLDFLERAEAAGWIHRTGNDLIGLGEGIPTSQLTKLDRLNSPKRIRTLLDRLKENDLYDSLDPAAKARLLARAGRQEQAARIEGSLANEAIKRGDFDEGMKSLEQALERHESLLGRRECDSLFISETLTFSNLCFVVGRGLTKAPPLLARARDAADRLGDRRSRALIDLHLGRLFYFSDRRPEALEALTAGKAGVDELGDEDIHHAAAEFLGLLFVMQGRFHEARENLERVVHRTGAREDRSLNPTASIFLAYCLVYLGQFRGGIGILDTAWRRAKLESDRSWAATFRASLGTTLLTVNKRREGLFHLRGAQREALEFENDLACYLSKAGLAYHSFLEGRLREARDTLAQAMEVAAHRGMLRQYASPWMMEMVFEFHHLGFDPIPQFDFQSQVDRAMSEPNIHLRGVALRLLAREAAGRGDGDDRIGSYLAQSEDCLKRSGDPIQLGKTQLEMARLNLGKGDRQAAREMVQEAWEGLSGYGEEFFPDDLRHLLEGQTPGVAGPQSSEAVLERFFEMMEELIPSPDLDEILSKAVAATNRFFGAERGGLFWFEGSGKRRAKPVLRVSCNLTEKEIASKSFRSQLELVRRTFREKSPLVARPQSFDTRLGGQGVLAILCLPIEVDGEVFAVLYHDNSYLDDCFDFIEGPLLGRLARNLSTLITRIWRYGRLTEEKTRRSLDHKAHAEVMDPYRIVYRSPSMVQLLDQLDQIAGTDSFVLLTGETGVGKEILAQRIHRRSPRHDQPYVVVDATTIPENLLESELFGHEKGAFTGADRQKRGRIELADGGTLFLDEVGELPLSIQGKLLRVLEQKRFLRLGGTRDLRSNFRLVAASNRNLAAEVTVGRFREDLFYRLNVVPLNIPPLRERGEDVVLLARYFLDEYAKRFGRPGMRLSRTDEARLSQHTWPGNVRELKNVMERTVLLSRGEECELRLPPVAESGATDSFLDHPSMDEMQRRYIRYILETTGNRIGGPGGAAEILGMNPGTLYSRMKKLGLK